MTTAMPRERRSRGLLWTMPLAVWLAASASLRGQAPDLDPVEFRRMYVPQQRLQSGPLDPGVRYGPLPKADFERLVELLRTAPPEARSTLAARIGKSTYRAQFLEDHVLSGQATLEVERPQSRAVLAVKGVDPGAMLPLSPCGLAVSHPRWQDDPPEDALCGLDAQGQFCVLTRRAGALSFDWTLRGTREPGGGWRYEFELPLSPQGTLTLELPESLTLRASRGVIVESQPAEGSQRQWQLALGGQHRFWIVLAPQDEAPSQEHATVLRQAHTYSLTPRGLELTTQLTLDVSHEPLKQLELSIDPTLKLLAARRGETHIPWTVIDEPTSEATRVLLEFPAPLQGLGNLVLLGATAPVKLDEPWRLPGIRAAGVFWQEGRATLLVPKPLAIQRLTLEDCRQSNIGSLPPPASGESIGLQYFQPQPRMEILLAHGQQRVQASTGTQIEISEDALQGRVLAEVRVNEGQVFSLQATVPQRWNIDNVVTDPPGRVQDWSLDTPTPRQRVLNVRLSQALTPEAPLRLIISGHRLSVTTRESLLAEELRVVELINAPEGEHFLSIRCVETHQLRVSNGEEVTRIDPSKLAVEMASLLAVPAGGLAVRLDPNAARLAVSLERLAPRYSAALRVTATVTEGPLWESYEVVCRPQGSRLERLLVYFSQARPDAPQWRLPEESDDQLAARRLSDEEMLEQCGRETGEMWELTLRRPRNSEFTLRAQRATPLDEDTPVSLIWLPRAEAQQGQLEVRCSAESAVHVRNARLRPLPLDPEAATTAQRGKFDYSPIQDTAAVDPAPLSLCREPGTLVQAAAIVWQAMLESRYEPTGAAHHTATWWVEGMGQSQLPLQLPHGVELDHAWVEENRFSPTAVGQNLVLPLPRGRRYITLGLRYRTRETSLGEVQRRTAPMVTTSVPVLASDWSIWLPPGYSLMAHDDAWQERDRVPLTLLGRLLGPLAGAGSARFDPTRAEDWRQLSRLPWEDQRARAAAYQFLDQLGAAPASTWAQVLFQMQPALELAQLRVLLDSTMLRQAGVTPQSVVANGSGDSPRARGLARLEASRLSLLVRGDVLLLTTAEAAAAAAEQCHNLEHAAVARVAQSALGKALDQTGAPRLGDRYCTPNQWSADPLAPWQYVRATLPEVVDTPGWSAHRISGPSNVAPQIEIVRTSTIQVFAWGVFLFLIAAFCRRWERPTLLMALACLCAVAALLTPEVYAPIASSALLGCLASLVWQAVVGRRQSSPPGPPSHSYRLTGSAQTIATGAVLLAILLAAARAWAAQDAPEALKPPKVIHKVFIPVDDTEQPVGDLYWVPEKLYTQMERRAARLALEPQGWLLEGADYRGVLTWDVAQQKLLVSELRLRFDLQVFEPTQRVRLPLAREAHTLVPSDRILIDGRDSPAEWEDEGRLLAFDIAQPGSYRLELAVRPALGVFADLAGFDLSVPPLPTARLELQLPRSSPAVEVTTAAGSVVLADEGRRLVAQLGRTPRLSVRWRNGLTPAAVRSTLDVDQLLWIRVQAGSVVADARWKFKVLEGSVRQVQLALDPRLQLQTPLETKNPLVAQTRLVAGNPLMLHVDLTRPVSDQFTLDATFRWAGASGVGNLRLPQVEAHPVRALRRWLGVTVDPQIEQQASAGEGLTALPPVEFSQLWGGMPEPPTLAYRQTGELPTWSLAVRPKPAQRSVDSVLAVSASSGRTSWRYDATVQTVGSCFEHRLQTPPALSVESVEVREEGETRLSHWSRNAEGHLTLFLAEPSSGPQQIALRGWSPLPPRGPWRLSGIRLEEAEVLSSQVRVYRQPSVTVEVRNRSGLIEQPELQREIENQLFESDHRFVGLGRLVSVLQADAPAYSATLLVTANQPRFQSRQITTLKREAGAWQAEVDCQVQVASGLLDALRWEIPNSWQPPFVVTPAANTSVIDAGDGTRQLVVRPVVAVTGRTQVRVRGNLVPPATGRLQLPSIALLGAEHSERLLVAPTQIDLQTVAWETRGLNRLDSPTDWIGSPGLAAPEAYQVVDDAFTATLQPATRPPGQPSVALADLSLSWQADASVQGVATFDVEPAGNRDCPLVLPPNYRLIQALVEGVPALAVTEGSQQWRLTLRSEELPQRVEVVFAGHLPAAAWRRQLVLAPTLGDLPVERTLWTIRGPEGIAVSHGLLAQRVPAWRQELHRLQSIAALGGLARNLSADADAAEFAAWREPWSRRFRQSRIALEREMQQARDAEDAASAMTEVRALEQEQARLFREPSAAPATRTVSAEFLADQPRQLWQFQGDSLRPLQRLALEGRSSELELQTAAPWWRDGTLRLLAAVGVGLAGTALLALFGSRWWPTVVRYRYLAVAVLGLCWWLWLSPSIMGWLILALAAVAALRDRAPPPREPGSAIVRLAR